MSDDEYNVELLNLHCSKCGLLFGSFVFDRDVKVTITADEMAQIIQTNKMKGLCPPCQAGLVKRVKDTGFSVY